MEPVTDIALTGGIAYLKVFLLNLNDDADGLGIDLNHVAELELAKGVDAGRHVRAELQVAWQHLQLVHRQIGEEDDVDVQNTDDEAGVALVAASNNSHVVTLWFATKPTKFIILKYRN